MMIMYSYVYTCHNLPEDDSIAIDSEVTAKLAAVLDV